MKTIKTYTISQDTLEKWSRIFVPDRDFFYFRIKPDHFPSHKITKMDQTAFTLDVRTSFLTWSINKKAEFICVMSNKEFQALSTIEKDTIIAEQKALNRGLVFTEDELKGLMKNVNSLEVDNQLEILKRGASFQDIVIVQKCNWDRVSKNVQHTILMNYADGWIEEYALEPEIRENYQTRYPELYPYMDTFPEENGPNCLAAVASAIRSSTDDIKRWMQVEHFLQLLEENHYHHIETSSVHAKDVWIWFNEQDQVVHAAYLLSEEHAFNKHGQTMFNPWQVIQINELKKAWADFTCKIYRKL
ncbi:hypothetical protein ABE65_004660 [Fictibacillus phosphorivorans]|uniref:Uncharacterized protein n=1 Tax=Fictibacillus phosphorivorans TaxID=1221500 RepID=A0A160IJ98_9BACL|nr:hypothetical protein [Fictibacillus phosphorivorans]ANC76138.1 hypothetical protein ABE65_004660 [Fictibacillus phosphorivorans]